jgi:flagellin
MAINDVSLTAGMRSNLLSLQSTVNLLDRTQTRLSTGKKVNTAIDNPTSFFAAQSLNSRASTIDSLKDAMGQAVQTIAAADKGIKAIASLIEQAKGIAQSALSAADGGATATGVVSLSAISATGGVGFTTGTITLTDLSDGDHMHLYSNDARDSGQTFLSRLVPDPLVAGEYQLTGGDMIATAAALAAEINDTNWAGMPDPDYYYTAHHNAGTATVTISRFLQSDDSQVDVVAGDFATMFPAKYSYVVNPAAGSADTIDIGGVTFTAENSGTPGAQEFYVSGNDLLDTHSLALAINTYDWSGEVATFNATVENGELFLSKVDNATGLAANVVAGDFDASGVTGGGVAAMTVEEGSSELSNLQDQYNTLCDQLTELAEDSGYKGKNLLSATLL